MKKKLCLYLLSLLPPPFFPLLGPVGERADPGNGKHSPISGIAQKSFWKNLFLSLFGKFSRGQK